MGSITFKDQKELACYLIDGNDLHDANGNTIYFKDGFYYQNRLSDKPVPLQHLWSDLTWYKKTEWYENIPEHGVLCRVWDNDESDSGLVLIINYDDGLTWPFETNSEGFKNAEPLTKEEILNFAENAK